MMSYSSVTLLIVVVLCWASLPLIVADNKPVKPAPSQSSQVIAPNCSDRCGSVSIPYPFGMEEGCYFNEHTNLNHSLFKIHCNSTTSPPRPIFGRNFEVLSISVTDAEFRSNFDISYDCYNESGYNIKWFWSNLNLVTFTLSSTKNILVAIGCDTYSWFKGFRHNKEYKTGCMTTCVEAEDVIDGECSGIGCCQASIPTGVTDISMDVNSYSKHTSVYQFNPCSVSFPIAKDAFRFNPKNLSLTVADLKHSPGKTVPAVFNWAIGTKNCSAAKADGSCLCKQNAECHDTELDLGYQCKCKPGFSGNPYLPHGCTDIDECKDLKNQCEKADYCINTLGAYYCRCPEGYHGHGTTNNPCNLQVEALAAPDIYHTANVVIADVCWGSFVLVLLVFWLYPLIKRRKLMKQRAIFFARNGGMLLQQHISSEEGSVERVKIFEIDELEKATDYFNEDRILGKGGHGTVYKGMLSEGKIVAVKKSNVVEESQMQEFINEVFVTSQLSHRNIVKMFGCCLETEVPLLVYEFITNGTLSDHIHGCSEDRFPLTWKMRLQIAADSAGALAYLHSSISTAIFHRDIKSSNILLDDKYRAKLSDFGTSRSVPSDQTHVLTHVVGTFGYLDPEYLQSHQFTEKSDVYSFGVVLVELLSGQKAIRANSEEERSLISWFLSQMENSYVPDIVDPEILQENWNEEFLTIANLAKRCLNLDGRSRPTMKEVLLEIEAVLSLHMPQTNHPNEPNHSKQLFAGTSASAHSSTFDLETRTLDSAELSILYNPR